jgi:hypothetical protein
VLLRYDSISVEWHICGECYPRLPDILPGDGASVVDYAVLSAAFNCWVPDGSLVITKDEWSDHARLHLELRPSSIPLREDTELVEGRTVVPTAPQLLRPLLITW